MIKRFIPIFLGVSLMFGLGINSNTNNIHKEVIQTKADNSLAAEIVFKKGTNSNPQSTVSAKTNFDDYISAGSNYIDSITTANYCYYSETPGTGGLKVGAKSSAGEFSFKLATPLTNATYVEVYAYLFNSSKAKTLEISESSDDAVTPASESTKYTFNFTDSNVSTISLKTSGYLWIQSISIYQEASSDPSITLNGKSTIDIFKGDSNSSDATFLVKNIDNVTADSWSFTFDEDDATAKTESAYVTVSGSTLTNNIGTLTINAVAIGTTKINVSVAGTACSTAITVNVKAKPASMEITHSSIKDNVLEIATGDSKTISFKAVR